MPYYTFELNTTTIEQILQWYDLNSRSLLLCFFFFFSSLRKSEHWWDQYIYIHTRYANMGKLTDKWTKSSSIILLIFAFTFCSISFCSVYSVSAPHQNRHQISMFDGESAQHTFLARLIASVETQSIPNVWCVCVCLTISLFHSCYCCLFFPVHSAQYKSW